MADEKKEQQPTARMDQIVAKIAGASMDGKLITIVYPSLAEYSARTSPDMEAVRAVAKIVHSTAEHPAPNSGSDVHTVRIHLA